MLPENTNASRESEAAIVSIVKCGNYEIGNVRNALKKTFDNLGGIEKFIKPGMKVVLKPNLVSKHRPEDAATTHPSVVKALAGMAAEAAVRKDGGRVIIAESPGGVYNEWALKRIYSFCGITQAAKETGAELNFDTTEIEIENPGGMYLKKITVIKPLIDADIVINLPKLKTHGMMVYTGAIKNMFGAVPGVLKAEHHFRMSEYSEFANALIDVYIGIKPALSIMDAVTGMEGHGPSAGKPRQIGSIIAGEDAFEVDLAALSIAGISPIDVPIMKEAVKRGLSTGNINDMALSGDNIEELKIKDFDVPQLDALRTIRFYDNSMFKFITNRLRHRPIFNHEMCAGCSDCVRYCPAGVVKMNGNKPYVEIEKCIRCFCCQELCPSKAVKIERPLLARFVLECLKKL